MAFELRWTTVLLLCACSSAVGGDPIAQSDAGGLASTDEDQVVLEARRLQAAGDIAALRKWRLAFARAPSDSDRGFELALAVEQFHGVEQGAEVMVFALDHAAEFEPDAQWPWDEEPEIRRMIEQSGSAELKRAYARFLELAETR